MKETLRLAAPAGILALVAFAISNATPQVAVTPVRTVTQIQILGEATFANRELMAIPPTDGQPNTPELTFVVPPGVHGIFIGARSGASGGTIQVDRNGSFLAQSQLYFAPSGSILGRSISVGPSAQLPAPVPLHPGDVLEFHNLGADAGHAWFEFE